MNEDTPIQNSPPSSIGLGDVLFTVFRHKWKILFFILLGSGAAAAILFLTKPTYTSTAKLLVRYVTESRGPDAAAQGNVVREPDSMGSTIINSEVEILTSSDSLIKAAQEVGSARILAPYGGGSEDLEAAKILAKTLKVDAGRNSTVITVSLSHRNAEIAQAALQALKEQYLDRHAKIHRAAEAFKFLQTQTDEIRRRLTQQETALQKKKNDLGVTSIDAAKEDLLEQISEIRSLTHEAQAELAQFEARLGSESVVTNDVANTNGVIALAPAPDLATLATYRRLSDRLERLKVRQLDLQRTYADESSVLKRTREDIAATEKSIVELGLDPSTFGPSSPQPIAAGPAMQTAGDMQRVVRSLKAKISALQAQEAQLLDDVKKVNNGEGVIVAGERDKALTEDLYLYFSKNLERARIDQSLTEGRRNNISVIQEPTFGSPASKSVLKQAGMAFGGLSGLGIALAFILDFFINPAFKRRKEVEAILRVPVFASVPNFGRNRSSRLRLRNVRTRDKKEKASLIKFHDTAEIAPWDDHDPMLPYYEAIRDRIVMSYEGDSHRPKIVGLTSSNHSAGVTRLATGVAAALSRDVERKVLLIALAKNSVALSAFDKGRPAINLSDPDEFMGPDSLQKNGNPQDDCSAHALEHLVLAQNLHSLATTGRNLAGASVVQSFCDLIPKLRAADYDYIIFDLPPLSETSGSLRLASQMERTLFVVEAEKSSKNQLKRARALLSETKTQMAAIYNRAESSGPNFLQSES